MKRLLLTAALSVAAAGGALAQTAEDCRTVRMGFNPAQDSNVVLTNGRAIADYLEQSVRGIEVRTSVAQDYRGLVEAMRSRQLDFAWLSPVSYVDAARDADARVLLKSVRFGNPYYWAAFIVRADSRFKTIKDLQGATIAWIDPTSAGGYTFPKATLLAQGIEPDKFFSKQTFAGGHDAAVLSVLNGTVDVAAVFSNNTKGTSGAWTQFLKDPAQQKQIRPIAYSKPIPGDTLSVRGSFQKACPEVTKKINDAIVAMRYFPQTKKLLANLYRIDWMIPALDKDYDAVREAQKLAGLK